MRRRSALRYDVLTVLLLCRVGRAQIPGRTFVDDMRRPVGELGEHAACPLDVLSEMQGRQISPRPPPGGAESHADAVPGEDGRGSMVPPRPDSFHSASSVIEHLPNGLIRKILPARSGEAEEDTQRRVLKEAELMATFYLYRNFPRVAHVDVRQRAIYMENCGRPLVQSNVPCDWRHQVLAILHVLQQHEVFHNDWLGLGWPATPNLTERDGILYLIDFSWATFGRDGYPFMNPSVDIVADASDMWQMFEKTRDQDEERRLRFQHALDKQALRSRLRSDPLWRDNPEIRVVRVIDRVGAKIQGQELHGARLTAAAISAEALRVLVSVSDVHPWCLAHCSDCSILLSLTNHSPSRDRWAASPCRHEEPLLQIRKSFCQCDLQADGTSFSMLEAVWDLEAGRYALHAGVSVHLSARTAEEQTLWSPWWQRQQLGVDKAEVMVEGHALRAWRERHVVQTAKVVSALGGEIPPEAREMDGCCGDLEADPNVLCNFTTLTFGLE